MLLLSKESDPIISYFFFCSKFFFLDSGKLVLLSSKAFELFFKNKVILFKNCKINFVATAQAGYPVPVPAFEAKTADEKRIQKYAQKMKEMSLQAEKVFEQEMKEE